MSLDPRHYPLRTQLSLLISALFAVVAAFFVFFFQSQLERVSTESLNARATELVRVLAKTIAPGVEFDQADAVAEYLEALKNAQDVTYAIVRRRDGTEFAALNGSRVPEYVVRPGETPSILLRDDQMHVAARIPVAQGGTLTIGFSLARFNREVSSNIQLVLTASLVIFALGIVASLLIGTYLTRPIRAMTEIALRIADGDLTHKKLELDAGNEVGKMAAAFDQMVAGQRALVRQIAEASAQIATAATQIHTAAQEQEAAGTQQSAAVEQVSRTMQSLLSAAAHIAESARGVLSNAERTRETTDLTAAKISELSGHAGRIQEILEVIRDIADRSDLLALNASLEATRAGEAGRSFSLVAAEMRRLAERVTASVEDVKGLVADVRSSGASTVVATEENRKLAEGTTESARQITMVTQQQRTGTEQVSQSMRDISKVISQAVLGTQQTRTSAESLKRQADKLADVIGRFRLTADGRRE